MKRAIQIKTPRFNEKKSLNKYRPLKLTEHDIAHAWLMGGNSKIIVSVVFFPPNK